MKSMDIKNSFKIVYLYLLDKYNGFEFPLKKKKKNQIENFVLIFKKK